MIAAEFRRLTATRLAVVAVIALTLVPVLYGGLYLWANQDPYAKLDQVPVALVIADTGTTADDGTARNYGEEVADEIVDDGTFDWHRVSAADAKAGVDDSTYDFSVTLPADFSDALASAAGTNPRQAEVTLTTNDANSYLSTTIGEQAVASLRTSIVERVNREAAGQLLIGIADIRTNISDAVTGSTDLLTGATTAADGAASLATGTATLTDGANQLTAGAQAVATGAQSAAAGASSLSAGAASAASGAQTLSTGASGVASGATTVADGAESLASAAASLSSGAQQVSAGTTQIATQADEVGSLADDSVAVLPAARKDIVATLKAAGISGDTLNAITSRLDQADSALTEGNTRIQAAVSQIDTLAAGSAAVATGSASLAAGAATLADGSASLATGANSVADGAQSLATGTATLASGAADLASGTATLATGTTELSSGAGTLAAGMAEASAASSALSAGLVTLRDGIGTLRDGLASGVAAIPETTPDSRAVQAQTIADPVDVQNTAVTAAGTYGAGLAPFFASLSAWIGIYALFLIVKPVSRRAITALHSPIRVTLAGWLTPGILGAIQMIGLFAVLAFALKFDMSNPVGVYGVMLLASLTFAAIILALNTWLGSVGQFLGLVLMVLQLVTAGGTFPWQTLPAPLAALHQVLPMSAAVDAMRQIMYGGNLASATTDIVALLYWLLGALVVSAVGVTRMTHFRTLRDLQPSLIG
jgi:putative membrane protein